MGTIILDCGHVVSVDSGLGLAYVQQQEHQCPECLTAFDTWASIRAHWSGPLVSFHALGPLGGRIVHLSQDLPVGEVVHLELERLGVPSDATVRGINLTRNSAGESDGIIIPALLFGNEIRQGDLPHHASVFLVPQGDSVPNRANFALWIQYIPKQPELHRRLMVQAVLAHGDGDHPRAMIDAHSAVDWATRAALEQRTGGRIGTRARLGFIERLSVVESLRHERGLSPLPARLRQGLEQLNTERNRVAHPSKKSILTSQEQSSELLTAAYLAISFAESSFGLPLGQHLS